ncbi:replication protein A 14 kDa subunit [Brienomyrus brachyistius]|uniref:replication protein A 14 kDa subunit n=1 Tax=Brienomyrus brachyistius TaxID=42636 RepID=UPI0020B399FF|nr:replication protein A 14 kDa subunit [Brienomyrus brachyistius]
MANVYESPKSRINSGMLHQYISKPVCFIGCVETVHPSGKSFVLIDGEGKKATVELNDPLDEELSGVVEVIGMVSNKATILATAYQLLRDDKGTAFDLELYNEALKIVHDFPEYYPFQSSAGGF